MAARRGGDAYGAHGAGDRQHAVLGQGSDFGLGQIDVELDRRELDLLKIGRGRRDVISLGIGNDVLDLQPHGQQSSLVLLIELVDLLGRREGLLRGRHVGVVADVIEPGHERVGRVFGTPPARSWPRTISAVAVRRPITTTTRRTKVFMSQSPWVELRGLQRHELPRDGRGPKAVHRGCSGVMATVRGQIAVLSGKHAHGKRGHGT